MVTSKQAEEVMRSREALHGQWIHLLGNMVYLFGQLEGCSYRVITAFATEDISRSAGELPFKARTRLAQEILQSRLADAQFSGLLDRWNSFTADLLAAGEDRNRYMHNPLTLTLDIDDQGEVKVDHGLFRMRSPKTTRVPLEEVEKFAIRLDDLCGRMSKLINEIAAALPAWRGR